MDAETRRAHERITNLETVMASHMAEHTALAESILLNTQLTREISSNTAELVTLVKGVKGLRSFVVWAAPLAAALLALWAWLKTQAAP